MFNYRHPGPRRVWKVGSEPHSLTPDPGIAPETAGDRRMNSKSRILCVFYQSRRTLTPPLTPPEPPPKRGIARGGPGRACGRVWRSFGRALEGSGSALGGSGGAPGGLGRAMVCTLYSVLTAQCAHCTVCSLYSVLTVQCAHESTSHEGLKARLCNV